MTLEKAIKEHEYIVYNHALRRGARSIEAIRLGIEALKRVKACRPQDICLWENLLPGETTE